MKIIFLDDSQIITLEKHLKQCEQYGSLAVIVHNLDNKELIVYFHSIRGVGYRFTH